MLLNNRNVFLVDDDLIASRFNRKVLENLGEFDIIETESQPLAAIRLLEEKLETKNVLPGVIVVDLYMPEIDGYQFISKVEELCQSHNIFSAPEFIVLSSSQEEGDFKQFQNTPFVKHFLSKPLVLHEIKEVLEEMNSSNI
jgi:CheY-like chemotaxis protein